MTDERKTILNLLSSGTLHLEGLIPWSSNYTFLAFVQNDEGDKHLAIYKPARGERPLWDFPIGTLGKREVAAYLLSEALGWNLVPPTVYRDGPHGPGMVQLFIEHDPEEHYFTFREEAPPEIPYVVAFDVLANNADRKAGHLLRDTEGHIWCIDHGICFHVEPKLRTVIWEFAGKPIPPPILRDLEQIHPALTPEGELSITLRPYLTPDEIAATRHRLEHLLTTERYPLPGPGRHIPWPMV